MKNKGIDSFPLLSSFQMLKLLFAVMTENMQLSYFTSHG